MVEMDGAISDVDSVRENLKKIADKKTEELKAIGINFTPKQ